eukprot:4380628-Ditylum_brightwellii.AAC.1
MQRKKQNAGGECQDHRVPNMMKIKSLLSDSAKSNDGKEVDETMLLHDVDDSVDGGDNHLTHLTHFESNDGVDGCEKFTHIAKNNVESLQSDVTDHVTHVFFGNMPVSKILTLLLRGGGLNNDKECIDNGQKDNDDKNNGDDTKDGDNNNNQCPSQGASFSSTLGSQNTSNRSHNHHHNYSNNFSSINYN